ncbi:hypothetical protein L195_g041314, partial [Trifolium pratense]
MRWVCGPPHHLSTPTRVMNLREFGGWYSHDITDSAESDLEFAVVHISKWLVHVFDTMLMVPNLLISFRSFRNRDLKFETRLASGGLKLGRGEIDTDDDDDVEGVSCFVMSNRSDRFVTWFRNLQYR